jgi:FixJ family two-component response regulator
LQWLRCVARRNIGPAIVELRALTMSIISIIDDDESVREGTMDLFQSMGFTAVAFPCAADFLSSNHLHDTSCLIADVQLPGMTGLELYNRLVGSGTAIPTILITAYPEDGDRARALQHGIICYLAKPFNYNDLLACVHLALESREAIG